MGERQHQGTKCMPLYVSTVMIMANTIFHNQYFVPFPMKNNEKYKNKIMNRNAVLYSVRTPLRFCKTDSRQSFHQLFSKKFDTMLVRQTSIVEFLRFISFCLEQKCPQQSIKVNVFNNQPFIFIFSIQTQAYLFVQKSFFQSFQRNSKCMNARNKVSLKSSNIISNQLSESVCVVYNP